MTFLLHAGRLLSLQPIQMSLQTGKKNPQTGPPTGSSTRTVVDQACAFGSRQSRSAENWPATFLRNEANFSARPAPRPEAVRSPRCIRFSEKMGAARLGFPRELNNPVTKTRSELALGFCHFLKTFRCRRSTLSHQDRITSNRRRRTEILNVFAANSVATQVRIEPRPR